MLAILQFLKLIKISNCKGGENVVAMATSGTEIVVTWEQPPFQYFNVSAATSPSLEGEVWVKIFFLVGLCFYCIVTFGVQLRSVPDEKIWGSLKAKHYIFLWGWWGRLFLNPVGGCLLWKYNSVGGCPSQKCSSLGILCSKGILLVVWV